MANKISNILKGLLFFAVGFLPYMIMQIISINSLKDNEFRFHWTIFVLFTYLLIDIYMLYYYRDKILSKKLEIFMLFKVCTIGLIVRFSIMFAFQTYPISDFNSVYSVASGAVGDIGLYEYVNRFIHLFYHAKLLNFVFEIFGTSILIAQMVNCFFSVVTMVFIYRTSKIIFSSQTLALIPVLLFACDVSLAAYTGVLAPEHISMAFLTVAIYFLSLGYKKRLAGGKCCKITIFYLLSGASLAISNMFKSVGIVIIIAIILVEIITYIPSVFIKARNLKRFMYNISKDNIPIFALLVVYCVGSILSNKYQNDSYIKLGYETLNKNPLFVVVYEGLAFEGKGEWNLNIKSNVYSVAVNHNYNKKEISKELKRQLFSDFKIHGKEYLPFLINKLTISWDPGYAYIYWSYRDPSAPPINHPLPQYETTVAARNMSRCYYIMLSMFGLVSSIFLSFSPKKIDNIIFLLNLITFGIALLFILIEAQGRYKSAIYPAMIIVIGYGAVITMQFVDRTTRGLFIKLKTIN